MSVTFSLVNSQETKLYTFHKLNLFPSLKIVNGNDHILSAELTTGLIAFLFTFSEMSSIRY